jgi:uncharacterized protein (DUF952 family)
MEGAGRFPSKAWPRKIVAMVLHILGRSEWEIAQRKGFYSPRSLEVEGFIHCSTVAQIIETANLFYRGRQDLLVLRIDERKLISRLEFEAPATAGDQRPETLFPHIYGRLNLDAVIDAVDLPCEPDGTFRLPSALAATP